MRTSLLVFLAACASQNEAVLNPAADPGCLLVEARTENTGDEMADAFAFHTYDSWGNRIQTTTHLDRSGDPYSEWYGLYLGEHLFYEAIDYEADGVLDHTWNRRFEDGNLVFEQSWDGPDLQHTLHYDYTKDGRPLEFVLLNENGGDKRVTWAYDAQGREVLERTDWDLDDTIESRTVTHWAQGEQLDSIELYTFNAGQMYTLIDYDYDASGRLVLRQNFESSGDLKSGSRFVYDGDLLVESTAFGPDLIDTQRIEYTYREDGSPDAIHSWWYLDFPLHTEQQFDRRGNLVTIRTDDGIDRSWDSVTTNFWECP